MEKTCPLVKGPCIEHRCVFYTHVLGKHPQSGADVDKWDCAIAWMPMLLVNLGKQVNDLGAGIDSFRNEQSLNTLASVARIIDDRQQKRLK